jgi:hypothetical protein
MHPVRGSYIVNHYPGRIVARPWHVTIPLLVAVLCGGNAI